MKIPKFLASKASKIKNAYGEDFIVTLPQQELGAS